MGYAVSVIRLVRILNCALAAVAALVGGYLQTLEPRLPELYLFAFIVALLCGAGNALNDRLDIDADRINHPNRPLPAGALKPTEASLVAVSLFLAAAGLSLLLPPTLIATVLLVSGLLVWYNYHLKRLPIIGNLIIAFLGGLIVVAGGVAAGGDPLELPGSLFPAALAFLLHFAREMTKDVEDLEGDRVVGFQTYPIRRTARRALNLAAVTVAALAVLTLAPIYFGWYNGFYTPIVIFTVDLPLLAMLIVLYRDTRPTTLRAASMVYKFGMVTGLVAVFLGGVIAAP